MLLRAGFAGQFALSVPSLEFEVPAGFERTFPFKITVANGEYEIDYDFTTNKPSGVEKHVDITNGSNSNTGNSKAQAYRDVATAEANGANVIFVHPSAVGTQTFYDRGKSLSNFSSAIDVAVIGVGDKGDVVMDNCVPAPDLSWTQQSAPNSNVYLASRSNVTIIHDTSVRSTTRFFNNGNHGLTTIYDEEDSIAACQANAGSWYQDGSNLYVHALDGNEPDASVRIRLNEGIINQNTDVDFYAENIVAFGRNPFRFNYPNTVNSGIVTLVDCAGYYSDQHPNFLIDDVNEAYLKNCVSEFSLAGDAYNYNAENSNASNPKIVEYNCTSYESGVSGDTSRNGSSAHDNVSIARFNCVHERCYGPVVIDVNETESLNLNVTANNSLVGDGNSSRDVGFFSGGTCAMFLKDCSADGSAYDRAKDSAATIFDMGGFIGGAGQDGDLINDATSSDPLEWIDNIESYLDFTDTDAFGANLVTAKDGTNLTLSNGGFSSLFGGLKFTDANGFGHYASSADTSRTFIVAYKDANSSSHIIGMGSNTPAQDNNSRILTATGSNRLRYLQPDTGVSTGYKTNDINLACVRVNGASDMDIALNSNDFDTNIDPNDAITTRDTFLVGGDSASNAVDVDSVFYKILNTADAITNAEWRVIRNKLANIKLTSDQYPVAGFGQSIISRLDDADITTPLDALLDETSTFSNQGLTGAAVKQESGNTNYFVNTGGTVESGFSSARRGLVTTDLSALNLPDNFLPYIIWAQGNADAPSIQSGTYDKAAYKTALENLFGFWTDDFTAAKFLISPLHRDTNESENDTGWQAIREVNHEIIDGDTHDFLCEIYDLDLADTTHLTETSETEMGNRIARRLNGLKSGNTKGTLGAKVVKLEGSGTSYTATVEHDAGTSLSIPNGDPKAMFRFEDSGGAKTISSVAVDDNTITITLSAASTGTSEKLYIGYGAMSGLSQTDAEVIMDNATNALPLRTGVVSA